MRLPVIVVTGEERVAAPRGAVVAIGNFDGVHRGHQALIERAMAQARVLGKPAGAIVFEPHPREFFVPDEPHFRLTPLPEKLRIFAEMGLDIVRVLTFDKALAGMSAQDFIARVLVEDLGVSGAVVGYDFFFGHKRAGTPQTLIEAGAKFGFAVDVVPPVAELGEVFSSTSVRLKLAEGDVAGAAHSLGRWWRVTGKVIGGAKRGTGMGYPTANVPMPKGTALSHGIFAVKVVVDGDWHEGAAYLGTRPTFDDGKPVLEVFLFDFDGDLYGREIAVEFVAFIRPDRKFDSMDALVAQMDVDVAKARAVLAQSK
ncbi:MAG: bifunctional riboflavin kinase/FAD synthetase [Hyphomicrobiaceae bacterium]